MASVISTLAGQYHRGSCAAGHRADDNRPKPPLLMDRPHEPWIHLDHGRGLRDAGWLRWAGCWGRGRLRGPLSRDHALTWRRTADARPDTWLSLGGFLGRLGGLGGF